MGVYISMAYKQESNAVPTPPERAAMTLCHRDHQCSEPGGFVWTIKSPAQCVSCWRTLRHMSEQVFLIGLGVFGPYCDECTETWSARP